MVAHNANINAKESKDFTALHMAVIINNLEIVQLLIEHNANIDCLNHEKMTPIK